MSRATRKARAQIEKCLVQILGNRNLILPKNSTQIAEQINSKLSITIQNELLHYLIQKLSIHKVIDVKDVNIANQFGYEIIQVEREKLWATYSDILDESNLEFPEESSGSMKVEEDELINKVPSTEKRAKLDTKDFNDDIMSLLSLPSTKEKQNKQVGEEILELLSKPTAKERSLVEKFKSQGAQGIMEFCPHGTRIECLKALQIVLEEEALNALEVKKVTLNSIDGPNTSSNKLNPETHSLAKQDKTKPTMCKRLHFKKIIQAHTDETLGDCSFLNTCFHMDSCKYVHYQVDSFMENQNISTSKVKAANANKTAIIDTSKKVFVLKRPVDQLTLHPPQWIQCDLRYLDMTIFSGKFAVIMMDPPWDIHMELPYGTMSDDEMRQLGVPALQDDGLIFLWVTGRAMELGRECLKLWGYDRVDELIWVKTNQLQRIIRTGRTGHWLNHGKEHCLVGLKGNPPNLNRGLDCDVIVAEVRATSHKPDEIYGIIERLSPGSRKIELFGRPHNVQPNWITLGNQLDGIRLVDPELITSFQKRYPDGLRWENS